MSCLFPPTSVSPETGPLVPNRKLASLTRLAPGEILRCNAGDLGQIQGVLVGSRRDTLLLASESREILVSLQTVDPLWVGHRSIHGRAKAGAIYGLGLGVAVGLGACALAAASSDTGTGPTAEGVVYVAFFGGLLGSAAGTAVGLAAGPSSWQWEQRYP